MRHSRLFLCALLPLLVAFSSARAGDDDRVTAQVRGFYQWYFHLLNTTPGDAEIKQHRREFGRYVTADMLTRITHPKGEEGQEGDPFFCQPDWDPAWEKNIEVGHVKAGPKGTATVEVRLSGKEMPAKHLKVSLMLEGGNYKITKVEEIRDETPDPPAGTATPAPAVTP